MPNRVPLARLDVGPVSAGDCLVVLLPGRFGGPRDYVQAEFDRWAAERGVPADLVAVDAHIGYYRKRSVGERIHRDVVQPARAAGYREIWIAGVSMGGLGSLLYTREHTAEVAGVIALAPFLGDDKLLDEIRTEGGPREWRGDVSADERSLAGLWKWLQREEASGTLPAIYLGFGTEDSLAPADRLLAELLPPEQVVTTEGGHDWRAWADLWGQVLDTGAVCQGGAGGGGGAR